MAKYGISSQQILTEGREEEVNEKYDPSEQDEIEQEFIKLLRSATKDGASKRRKGEKVSWKYDPGHNAARRRHEARYELDHHGRDSDSGSHHLVAVAWRALAQAWQETHPEEVLREWKRSGYGA